MNCPGCHAHSTAMLTLCTSPGQPSWSVLEASSSTCIDASADGSSLVATSTQEK
jgi:hypothetical protein